MSLKISIPSASIADTSQKPYTVYNILVRFPLREHTISKRYSEFLAFHNELCSHAGSVPPVALPPKSYWSRIGNSPSLMEDRRSGLERYLVGILDSADPRWRSTTVWRQFLNLPASWTAGSTASRANAAGTNGAGGIASIAATGQPVTDPGLWLDVYRELKTLLHDARLFLTKRDQAVTPAEQHECSAGAKRCLVKAGGILTALESGLRNLVESAAHNTMNLGHARKSGMSNADLGEGELRRRKDLLASARKERDGLEALATSLATKRNNTGSPSSSATTSDKAALFGSSTGRAPGRRVLGASLPETDRTRELDNTGVVQLQQNMLQEQEQDLESLLKTVSRQKEIGQAINQELLIQNEMLDSLDRDVDRLEGKLNIGNRRINKVT